MRILGVLTILILTVHSFASDCPGSLGRQDAGLRQLEREARRAGAPVADLVRYWLALRSKGRGPSETIYRRLEGTATGRPNTSEAQAAKESFRNAMLLDPTLLNDPFPVIIAEAARRRKIPLEQVANIHPRAFEFIPILKKGQSIEFQMGSPKKENGRSSDEKQHRVKLDHPFAYGATVVPVGIYRLFLDIPQGYAQNGQTLRDEEPIRYTTWHNGQALVSEINKIAKELGLPGRYRMPREAETELVSRMDGNFRLTETAYAFGNVWDDRYGHDSSETANGQWPLIDTKVPLPTGVADLTRMIRQWQEDWYDPNYGLTAAQLKTGVENPMGAAAGSDRVVRGGGAGSHPQNCRAARRLGIAPSSVWFVLGLRLLREDYDE